MKNTISYRLPTNVKPTKYQIAIIPDLQTFAFEGEETITIEVLKPTISISLNACELKISYAHVIFGNETILEATNIELDSENERANIHFSEPIPKGRFALKMGFRGILNDQLRGFYRVAYTDFSGNPSFLLCTQFEPTDARKAFPCWDEPAIKATFEVSLIIPSHLTALANTSIASQQINNDGTSTICFKKTPPMSTYYLAFIVGDLASVEQISSDGTLVRVWATRGKEGQGEFALATSTRLLDYFNNYFGIPYPLDKLDHIAVPDFAAGAMENWGAITYREAALLFDETSSSANTKQRIAEIIAHEMAHMWFGDLVTMEWWDDLWLNESFASWMGNKAVDTLFPEWDMWTQFLLEDTNAGLVLDGLTNSHSIEMPVTNPSEIGELFDAISYSKGAAILRMLEVFLGEETFRAGVKTYLSTHQYANARTKDLWNSLTLVSQKPIGKIMNTWIKQPGFPILEIGKDSDLNLVTIEQNRFLYSHILGDESSGKWEIPLSLEATGSSKSVLINTNITRIPVVNPLDLKINTGHVGFFRTNYSPEQWESLKVSIVQNKLSANDRLGIQNDAFALTKGGYLSPEIYLSLTEAYKYESHVSVWESIAINLKWIERLIYKKSYFKRFQLFCQNLFIEKATSIGWDAAPGEKHLDSLLRSVLLTRIAAYGHSDTLHTGLTRYSRFLEDPSSLQPDLKDIVFGIAAKQGSQRTFDEMFTLYENSDQHEEKVRMLRAMSMFSDNDLLKKTLAISLNQDLVRNQDVVSLVTSIANNNAGLTMAWDFVKSNWPEFDRRYGDGGFAIMRLVAMTGNFISSRKADDVKAFFENNPTPSAARTIKQSIERINLNAAWLDRYDNDLQRWFSKYPNKA